APDERGQRAFRLDQFQRAAGVVDDRLALPAAADDARTLQQGLDIAFAEARHAREVDAVERAAEAVALGPDRAPAPPRLDRYQAQHLEQAPVVGDREAPLPVVVGEELRRRRAPAAAGPAIGSGNRRVHRRLTWIGPAARDGAGRTQAYRPAGGHTHVPAGRAPRSRIDHG